MAEFDDELTAMFQAPADEAVAERVAGRAVARIDGEDRRRSLFLTTGVVSGVGVSLMAVARSGVIGAVRDLFSHALAMPSPLPVQTLVWAAAAVGLAVYAAATMRPGRAL